MRRAQERSRFILSTAKRNGKYVTRDGRKVVGWKLIHDPKRSLWPIEVTVETRSKARITYVVNQNGRRYANIISEDDIFEVGVRKSLTPWPYDCMPDPIAAISYIKGHRYEKVKTANRLSCEDRYSKHTKAGTAVEIGTL